MTARLLEVIINHTLVIDVIDYASWPWLQQRNALHVTCYCSYSRWPCIMMVRGSFVLYLSAAMQGQRRIRSWQNKQHVHTSLSICSNTSFSTRQKHANWDGDFICLPHAMQIGVRFYVMLIMHGMFSHILIEQLIAIFCQSQNRMLFQVAWTEPNPHFR